MFHLSHHTSAEGSAGRSFLSQRERLLSWLFICCLSSFFSPKFACTAFVLSVVILEQLGFCFLLILSLNVTLTTAASGQREWGGASCSLFKYYTAVFKSKAQLMLVVKLYKTEVLKLGPSDCWGSVASAPMDE